MNRLSGTQLTIIATLFAGVVLLASIAGGDVTNLESIELAQTPTATTYLINPTGVIQYQEYALEEPKRLVIDLVDVKNVVESTNLRVDGRFVSAVRASQFQSEPDLVTRVVFELAEGTKYKVSRKGTAVEVVFTGPAGDVMGADLAAAPLAPVASTDAADPNAKDDSGAWFEVPDEPAAEPAPAEAKTEAAPAPKNAAAPSPNAASAAAPTKNEPAPPAAGPLAAQSSPAPADDWADAEAAWPQPSEFTAEAAPADEVQVAQNTSTRAAKEMSTPLYGETLANQPITIDVQGADIKTVLRSISEFSGVNIIAAPDVEGPVVIHLKNVPWKEALDSILRSQGYGWRDDYGIIRVAPIEQLQEDEVKAVTVDRKKEEMASLQTRVVKLDYLNAKEIKTAMSKMTSPRGSVEADQGTNSVIVAEVPARIDRLVQMIKDMDQRLRQVEIVAKMVDVDHEATRELGVNWEALNLQAGSFAGDIVTGQALADPFGTLRVGTVQSWGDLNLIIEAMERDNKANIVSNPKISTADNQEARIMVGKEIPLIVSDEAGNPITELKKIGVILRVTPHVNADGTITMDLHPELSDLATQATVQGGVIINLQEADTRVVVRDGETAVIGGLISDIESNVRTGVPVLKDVPLLGALFRFDSKTSRKRELIIFVTPKVVS
ncbi:MAG TPA: secretin N-terminal domain-containing protein [Candidatus Krumholzibacteria bacterium]|nr:secretin N-terminal domain-containing protein [Candidatus Krumholzibacteria bacterium]